MRAYRMLLRLYPREFRDAYADDLVALLDDLRADKGRARALQICAVDLAVTVPRMHLERIMNPTRTTTAITMSICALAVLGVTSILTGLYPGALLLLVAAGLSFTHRSALGRALRVPDTALRRHRLRTSALLGAVFVVCYAVFIATIGDEWTGRETVLALIGTVSMLASIGYLIAGLATPRAATAPA